MHMIRKENMKLVKLGMPFVVFVRIQYLRKKNCFNFLPDAARKFGESQYYMQGLMTLSILFLNTETHCHSTIVFYYPNIH